MSENNVCKSKSFDIDNISMGILIALVFVDAGFYFTTHFPEMIKYFHDHPERTSYLITKHISITLTIIISSITIPNIVYKNICQYFPETKNLIKIFCFFLSAIIAFSLIIIFYFKSSFLSLIPPVITVYFVCMGWWIQSMITSQNNKKSHTLNTVLGSRTSELITSNNKEYVKLIPSDHYLDSEIARAYVNNDYNIGNNYGLNTEKEKNYLTKSIQSCTYILNYFEFLAGGIINGDLDIDLIKSCYSSIFKDIDAELCFIIMEMQEKQPTAFENFTKIVEEWHGTTLSKEMKRKDVSSMPGTKAPTNKYIKELKSECEGVAH